MLETISALHRRNINKAKVAIKVILFVKRVPKTQVW